VPISRVGACVALHVDEQIHTVEWLEGEESRVIWRGDGVRTGCLVTNAVWSPVRLATQWMRVAAMALARVMAGRRVVSRRPAWTCPPRGAQGAEVTVNMPASPAVSRGILQRCAARTPDLAVRVRATPVASYGAGLMDARCV
jgi:hypothetical protein